VLDRKKPNSDAGRWRMATGTRARSYDEMAEALATEGLPALQNTLTGLAPQD
jgi:hypothetical protein